MLRVLLDKLWGSLVFIIFAWDNIYLVFLTNSKIIFRLRFIIYVQKCTLDWWIFVLTRGQCWKLFLRYCTISERCVDFKNIVRRHLLWLFSWGFPTFHFSFSGVKSWVYHISRIVFNVLKLRNSFLELGRAHVCWWMVLRYLFRFFLYLDINLIF